MSFAGTASKLAGLQTSKHFNVSGMAILMFDYVITLEDEARWVWGRTWDATRLVFTVSRYLPFADAAMTAYVALRSNSEPCGPSSGQSSSIVHMLGIIAAEVLLVLRTYAYWQGNKRVLYGLLAYGGVTIAGAVGISIVPIQLIPGAQSPPGCYLTASRNSTLHFRSYRDVRISIVYTIYRDGMFYIVCIILITFANTIVDGAFSFQFSDLLDIPQITLHSVLASRIMFNLRKSIYYEQKGPTMDSIMFSDDAFYRSLNSESNDFELSGKGSESRGLMRM
ncbi:hypothetical protein V8E55_006475 [Tylopilus felleus]